MRIIVLLALACVLPATAMNLADHDLLRAVANGNLEDVRSALKQGACINIKSKSTSGFAALHGAVICRIDNVAMIKLLLANSANPNITDNHGNTPLHWVLCNLSGKKAAAAAKLLLDYDANTFLVNNVGQTAYDIAEISGNTKVCELIREKEKSRWRLAKIAVPEATSSESASSTDQPS